MTLGTSLRIEEATEKDVPLILQFIKDLAQYEKELARVTATEERLRASLFGSRHYASALIAYIDAEPAAFAIYFFSYASFTASPNLYLEDLFVHPKFRGFGVGKDLLAFLARRAIEHGCARMEWSVLNWNASAIGFYKSLGAEPVRKWTVFHLPAKALRQLAELA
jgi:GNAT superfamily N-acetyltransferase